jgi:hypothetical protein
MSPILGEIFPSIFRLRWCIARLGENDAMGWWDSHALMPQGKYALGRVFRRTTELSAADLAFRAAQARHDDLVPDERLIHLFHLEERVEGEFQRWLMDRKADGWKADLPDLGNLDPETASVPDVLDTIEIPAYTKAAERTGQSAAMGSIPGGVAEHPDQLLEHARQLAGAYALSDRTRLVAPYLRVQR